MLEYYDWLNSKETIYLAKLMLVLYVLLTILFATKSNATSYDPGPWRYGHDLSGTFKFMKFDKAKVKCDMTVETGWEPPPTSIVDVKGCFIDLVQIKSTRGKKLFTKSISLYANGAICDRKVGETMKLRVAYERCKIGNIVQCAEKPILHIVGDFPMSYEEFSCATGRWKIKEN
jgi:hypothetical protein